jgi:hypothetical protein
MEPLDDVRSVRLQNARDSIPVPDACYEAAGERGECSVATAWAPRCSNVLELGAGSAGSVSQALSAVLRDPARHVALEADRGAYEDHARAHPDRKYTLVNARAQDYSLGDALEKLGGNVDCVVSDCEDCVISFLDTELGKHTLEHARVWINEMDGSNSQLRARWRDGGLCPAAVGYGCEMGCQTEVWQRDVCRFAKDRCERDPSGWACADFLGH